MAQIRPSPNRSHELQHHENLGCEPATIFDGRIPYNILDIKLGKKPEWKKDKNEDLTDELQKQLTEIHQAAKDNLMQSYIGVQTILRQESDGYATQGQRLLLRS